VVCGHDFPKDLGTHAADVHALNPDPVTLELYIRESRTFTDMMSKVFQ
jgi:hypothetical protein